jgi:hypothetical protein
LICSELVPVVDTEEDEVFFGQLTTKECMRICDRVIHNNEQQTVANEFHLTEEKDQSEIKPAQTAIELVRQDQARPATATGPSVASCVSSAETIDAIRQKIDSIMQFNPENTEFPKAREVSAAPPSSVRLVSPLTIGLTVHRANQPQCRGSLSQHLKSKK